MKRFLIFFLFATFSFGEPFIPSRWELWRSSFPRYYFFKPEPLLIEDESLKRKDGTVLLKKVTTFLAIDSQNPKKFYVGGEDSEGCGCVFKTLDGGREFLISELPTCKTVNWVTIDKNNSEIVYAAQGRSLYKSIDGGGKWDLVFKVDDREQRIVAAIFPFKPNEIYLILAHPIFKSDPVKILEIKGNKIKTLFEKSIFSVNVDNEKMILHIEPRIVEFDLNTKKIRVLTTEIDGSQRVFYIYGELFKIDGYSNCSIFCEKRKKWIPVRFGNWKMKKIIDSTRPEGYRLDKRWIYQYKVLYITKDSSTSSVMLYPLGAPPITKTMREKRVVFLIRRYGEKWVYYPITVLKAKISSEKKEISFKVE